MKKNVAKLLAGIIVCAMLAGCGGSEQKPEPMDQNSQAQAQELAQDDAGAQEAQAQSQGTQTAEPQNSEAESLTSQAQDDAGAQKAQAQAQAPEAQTSEVQADAPSFLGKPMADFSAQTISGGTFTLSESLKKHDLVLVNFFFTGCVPCGKEFPIIEEAYEKYKDRFDVVSLSTDPDDTDDILAKYAGQLGLTFHVGSDNGPGLSESVISELPNRPLSLFVDRFGNVAYYEKGAFVNQAKLDRVINYFLSDEYTQSTALTQAPEPKPGKNAGEEALAAALNAEGGSLRFYNSEDSTVWPMVPTEKDGRKGVMTTNMQVDNSTSSIYLAVNAAEGDVLSFDYSMSAAAYKTRLTILIDGEGVKCFNGMHDWTGWSIELPAGEHEICFRYTKSTFTEGEDTVWLSNMRIESGDDAKKALASLPSYPAGERFGAEILAQGARHVIVECDSPDVVTGMDSTDNFNYYMLPEGSGPITMRVTLTEDMDPGAAFIANFVARTVTAYENTLTEDRGDYIYTTDPALLRDGFTYIVSEYDPPNDAAPTTCTTFITYSEEILDEILRTNGESMGVTFTWHYDE